MDVFKYGSQPLEKVSLRVAVTGANGHVGVNLVDRLLAEGHQVRAFDLGGFERLDGKPVERFEGDIRDEAGLARCFRGVDTVFHLAALISIDGDRGGLVYDINVGGARTAARTAMAAGVGRFVHFSSIHAFETQRAGGEVNEDSPRATGEHCAAYDRSKALGEVEVRHAIADGLDAVILHPTGVIGPKDPTPSRAGKGLLDAARGRIPIAVDGGFNWVDVRDVAAAACQAARQGVRGHSYILGGAHYTMEKMAGMAAQRSGAWAPLVTLPLGVVRRFASLATLVARVRGREPIFTVESLDTLGTHVRFSNERARRELDMEPRGMEQTIADLVDWFAATDQLDLEHAENPAEELHCEFARHLHHHPIHGGEETELLGRMLAAIVLSDGETHASERELLSQFTEADAEDLLEQPPPSAEELRALPTATRESLLLVATALACVDEDYSQLERRAVGRLRDELGIDSQRARQLEGWAKAFVVDQLFDALYADGVLDAGEHKRIEECAARLDLTPAELDRLEERARRRRGLAPHPEA